MSGSQNSVESLVVQLLESSQSLRCAPERAGFVAEDPHVSFSQVPKDCTGRPKRGAVCQDFPSKAGGFVQGARRPWPQEL